MPERGKATATARSDWALQGRQGTGTILIIEEEDGCREMAKVMLSFAGFATLEASNGRDGVRLYREHAETVRLVLLDFTMKGLDGPKTLQMLREVRPDVTVVIWSGYCREHVTRQIGEESFAGYIGKPCSLPMLLDTVFGLLDAD